MVSEIIVGTVIGNLTSRLVDRSVNGLKGMYGADQYIGGDITHGKKFANFSGASIVPGDSASVITAESIPDRDGGLLDSGWDCFKWMSWHKRLVEKHGKEKANELFMSEWNKQSTWDTQYNWCKYDSDWQKYFEAQGLPSHWLARLLASAGQTAASVGDSAEKLAEDGIGGFGDSLGKLLKWLPWIAGAALLVFAYFYFKPFSKVAS